MLKYMPTLMGWMLMVCSWVLDYRGKDEQSVTCLVGAVVILTRTMK